MHPDIEIRKENGITLGYLRAARAEKSTDQRPAGTPTANERAKKAAKARRAKAKKRKQNEIPIQGEHGGG